MIHLVVIVLAGLVGATFLGGIGLAANVGETSLLLLSTIGMAMFQILALYAILRQTGHSFASMGMIAKTSDGLFLGIGLILQLALALLALPFLELMASEDGSTQVVVDQVANVSKMGARVGVFLLVGLVGPMAEELVFRGALLQLASQRFRPQTANVVTAALFSLVHVIGLDINSPWAGVVTLSLLFLLGLVLGALTLKYRRLGPAIFTHAGYNLATLMLLYAAPQLVS